MILKNNIALGINNENIDLNLVSNALKYSNSTKFVDNLPKKLRLMLEIEHFYFWRSKTENRYCELFTKNQNFNFR